MFKKIIIPYTSLEPTISDEVLETHYNNHYLKYVENLNKLVNNTSYSLKDIIIHIDDFDKDKGAILFNAGGVLNHELYFLNMSLKGKNNEKLTKLLTEKYGSFDNFIKEFKAKANSLQGSGYTFLVLKDKDFDIINLANQDNPYRYDMIPLLALDLWEHAYYLQYKSNRTLYIDHFMNIINYDEVYKRYEKETK